MNNRAYPASPSNISQDSLGLSDVDTEVLDLLMMNANDDDISACENGPLLATPLELPFGTPRIADSNEISTTSDPLPLNVKQPRVNDNSSASRSTSKSTARGSANKKASCKRKSRNQSNTSLKTPYKKRPHVLELEHLRKETRKLEDELIQLRKQNHQDSAGYPTIALKRWKEIASDYKIELDKATEQGKWMRLMIEQQSQVIENFKKAFRQSTE